MDKGTKPRRSVFAGDARAEGSRVTAHTPSEMMIEWWPVERVIPYERNARRNDGAVDAVAESIRRYGWQQAIVVDKAGVIIAGHTRLKAALKLGLATVPVKVADLPAALARQYRLADNKTHELAEWDDQVLALEIADMMDHGTTAADLTAVGFDDIELAELRGDVEKKGKGGGDGEVIDGQTQYCVVIESSSESQQEALYNRFKAEGLKCRILTY